MSENNTKYALIITSKLFLGVLWWNLGVLEQLLYPKGLLQSIRLFWWLEIQWYFLLEIIIICVYQMHLYRQVHELFWLPIKPY